jgi:diacylglycerol O-acyltransferase / trehalose O-mycolyltransferase
VAPVRALAASYAAPRPASLRACRYPSIRASIPASIPAAIPVAIPASIPAAIPASIPAIYQRS